MRKYEFATVDVFTTSRFGGNPLAVFIDGAGLTDGEMQSLAAEMNYSETTFVLPPKDAGQHRPCPHLQSHRRDAVCRPPQRRHRIRACRVAPRAWRPAPLRGAGGRGRGADRARGRRPAKRRRDRRPAAAAIARRACRNGHGPVHRAGAGRRQDRHAPADAGDGRRGIRAGRGRAGQTVERGARSGGLPRRRLEIRTRPAAVGLPLRAGRRCGACPHVRAPCRDLGGPRHGQRERDAGRAPVAPLGRGRMLARHPARRRNGPAKRAQGEGPSNRGRNSGERRAAVAFRCFAASSRCDAGAASQSRAGLLR